MGSGAGIHRLTHDQTDGHIAGLWICALVEEISKGCQQGLSVSCCTYSLLPGDYKRQAVDITSRS